MILLFPFSKKLRNNKPNPKSPPISWWKELISLINEPMIQLGITGEYQLVDDFRINLSLPEIKKLIEECDNWISIDSFAQHYCWDCGKPGIVIWGQSNPKIFGHPENINLLKSTEYLFKEQFLFWELIPYREDCFISPQEVVKYLTK